jgi:hypothetical protein
MPAYGNYDLGRRRRANDDPMARSRSGTLAARNSDIRRKSERNSPFLLRRPACGDTDLGHQLPRSASGHAAIRIGG